MDLQAGLPREILIRSLQIQQKESRTNNTDGNALLLQIFVQI